MVTRRLDLARCARLTLPTPITPRGGRARHLGDALTGGGIYVERDDLAVIELGGDTLRKRDHLPGGARDEALDTVITVGATPSNHPRPPAAGAPGAAPPSDPPWYPALPRAGAGCR
jgi:1-aminocyclopropane-1-carboxylate deaminase/D-cysteine desulfhydrase-like pyridoxal-dependent ACC family enzyme